MLQVKLNALDAGLFALPPEATAAATTAPHQGPLAAATEVPELPLPDNCLVGKNMMRYFMRPLTKKGLNYQECGEALDAEAVVAALKEERPQALEEVEKARKKREDTKTESGNAGEEVPGVVATASPGDLAITFLGTGAAIPSKYRNVTGLLIDRPDLDAAMLADCGEGSLGQLHRRLGAAGAHQVLRRLALVWISHIHADHHVGLPALLAERTRLLGPQCPPLLVIGPRPLRRALASYAALEPMKFRFVEAVNTTPEANAAIAAEQEQQQQQAKNGEVLGEEGKPMPEDIRIALEEARQKMGLKRLESIRVVHCAHSYGLLLESTSGWKVVFSGDTRPCEALIEASRGATLLIHEATFDDSMVEEAIAKKHCTTKEAVEVGVAAGTYRTILTHFSQRYPKVPVINESFVDHVGIAFDLMTVRLTDLPRLPSLVPAVKVLFDEEEEEEGEEDKEPEVQMFG